MRGIHLIFTECDVIYRCCCCANHSAEDVATVVGDTCSGCHLAALKQSCGNGDFEVIYASFHVDVSETPFFVAIDYDNKSVVVSIRGTISMKVTSAFNLLAAILIHINHFFLLQVV